MPSKKGIIAFVTDSETIQKILKHIGQYEPPQRAPPRKSNIEIPCPPSTEWEYVPAEHIP